MKRKKKRKGKKKKTNKTNEEKKKKKKKSVRSLSPCAIVLCLPWWSRVRSIYPWLRNWAQAFRQVLYSSHFARARRGFKVQEFLDSMVDVVCCVREDMRLDCFG